MRLGVHSFCDRNRAQELEREAYKVHARAYKVHARSTLEREAYKVHGVVQPGMWALPDPGTAQVPLEPAPYGLERAAYVSPAIGCIDRVDVSLHLFF